MYSDFSNPDRSWITLQRASWAAGAGKLPLKLGKIAEQVEGCRICQRVAIEHRAAVDHVPNRQFRNLPADGPRNIGNLEDFFGDVMGAGILANPPPDPACQLLRQAISVPQPDEENDPDVALPVLPNHKALKNFGNRLNLPVQLGGSDANPAGVEGRVASAEDDQTIVPGEPGPVSVAPHPGKLVEVGPEILVAPGVVPERDRHAGERASAN